MKRLKHAFTLCFTAPGRPVHFANLVSFNNLNYNASWMYSSNTDTLHFMVEVRATGWIGFGVATQAPNNMVGYDVAVGGVLNGSGYLRVNCFSVWASLLMKFHPISHARIGPRHVSPKLRRLCLTCAFFQQDYLSNGFSQPPLDYRQDWILSYSSEENGATTLRFYRKRNTSDASDFVVQVSCIRQT